MPPSPSPFHPLTHAYSLLQVADETGEVQYATQTVTVTERDAKALGQPVGSTTTVLLTAYPGGQSGASGTEATTAAQPVSDQLTTTQQSSTSTNVQVVYSASHIDSIETSTPSSIPQSVSETFTSTLASSGVAPEVTSVSAITVSGGEVLPSSISSTALQPQPEPTATTIADIIGGTDYLNPTEGGKLMVGGVDTGGVGGTTVADANEGEDPANDLATQLINQYSSGEDGTAAVSEVAAAFDITKPTDAIPVTSEASQAANVNES